MIEKQRTCLDLNIGIGAVFIWVYKDPEFETCFECKMGKNFRC
jgi:hypothetical protein